MLQAVYLIATSFPTGILIGLTGIGGAAFMTPFLILVIGLRPDLAVGTDLAYVVVTKAVGSWFHWKRGHVDVRLACQLASASLPAAALGTLLMTCIHYSANGDERLKGVIGVVLAVVAAVSALLPSKIPADITRMQSNIGTAVYAGVAGLLVGLTSVGSGSLVLPFLLMVNRLPVVRAVGTDIFHAMVLVAWTAVLHASTKSVQWEMVPWLLLGSLPGVVIGSRLAPRLPERLLRLVVVAMLLLSAFRLLA